MNSPGIGICCLILAGAIAACNKPAPNHEPQPAWKPNRDSLSAHPPAGMRFIKGGEFRMGGLDKPYDSVAEASRIRDSGVSVNGSAQLPSHQVVVGDFYMDTTEVTESEWKRLMGPTPDTSLGDSYPVAWVNWVQAVLYCNAKSKSFGLDTVYRISGFETSIKTFPNGVSLSDTQDIHGMIDMTANGFRLPTEAEFEYAARAGSDDRFPWGPTADTSRGWWKSPGRPGNPRPVATRPANTWGLYDLLGNVGEWVNDGYFDENYYGSGPLSNPHGTEDGRMRLVAGISGFQPAPGIYRRSSTYRVYRGGDLDGSELILVTPRHRAWTGPSQNIAGFRTVLQVR